MSERWKVGEIIIMKTSAFGIASGAVFEVAEIRPGEMVLSRVGREFASRLVVDTGPGCKLADRVHRVGGGA